MSATADAAVPHLIWPRRHDRGRSTLLSLYGDCDLATRGQLQVALAQAVSGDDEDVLILDLSRLDFCDVGCARLICEASRAGHVVVTGMSASLGRMFDLLDLDLTLSRRGDVHDNLHLVPAQGRGLRTSTTSTRPSRDPDGARSESADEVHLPTPDGVDFTGLTAPPAGRAPSAARPEPSGQLRRPPRVGGVID